MATHKTITTKFSRWMEKNGFKTVEDFAREAWRRGVPVRVGTVYLWSRGESRPDRIPLGLLGDKFPGIQF